MCNIRKYLSPFPRNFSKITKEQSQDYATHTPPPSLTFTLVHNEVVTKPQIIVYNGPHFSLVILVVEMKHTTKNPNFFSILSYYTNIFILHPLLVVPHLIQ